MHKFNWMADETKKISPGRLIITVCQGYFYGYISCIYRAFLGVISACMAVGIFL